MKTKQLLILLLLLSFSVKAQNITYEKLEEFSTVISQLQFEASGQNYNDGTSDCEISFPKANFEVAYNSLLASNAIYKKNGDNEVLELTENIDLSKLLSAKFIHTPGVELAIFRMQFPKASLNTKKYINGVQNGIAKVDYLDLFVSSTNPWDLYNSMINLCYRLKAEKKLPNTYNIDELDKKWKEAVEKISSKSFEEFIKKYPNTLYQPQSLRMIDIFAQRKIEGEENFMKYVYFENYTIGQTLEQAKIEYPEFYKKIKKYKFKDQALYNKIYANGVGGLKIMAKDDKIVGYWANIQEQILDDANFTKGNKAISELVNELKNEFFFEPKVTTSDYNDGSNKFDNKIYTWDRNGKSVAISYLKRYFSDGFATEIILTQLDPQ